MTKKQRVHTVVITALVTTVLTLTAGLVLAKGIQYRHDRANHAAEMLDATFTYQGQLKIAGEPVTANCEMAFRLYDAAEDGGEVSSAITTTVPITEGLFTVGLNFGLDAFSEEARWLGIQVKCPTDVEFVDLGRQALTAAPYAVYALQAPWTGLQEMPPDIADGDDDTTYAAGEGLSLGGTTFNAEGSPYAHVIVVAKSGGDFTAIQPAVDSITDAGAANAYLVWVAPGTYSETVTMKPHVHIQGAGQGATLITSTVGHSNFPTATATLKLAHHTSLRDLTIVNAGAHSKNTALLATVGTSETLVSDVTVEAPGHNASKFAIYLTGEGTAVTLNDVTALAENGANNYALYNGAGAATTIHGGAFTARNGTTRNTSILNRDAGTALHATDVTARAAIGERQSGLANSREATANLYGGSFRAYAEELGDESYGIAADNSSVLEVHNVTALASGTYINAGLLMESGAQAHVYGGSFRAEGHGWGFSYGIRLLGAGTQVWTEGVTALAEDSSLSNHGLGCTQNARANLRGGSFTGRGGDNAYGIYINGGLSIIARDIDALAEGSTDGANGLSCTNSGATALVDGGSFIARDATATYGLHAAVASITATQTLVEGASSTVHDANLDSSIHISHGRLVGGAAAGNTTCVAVSRNDTFNANGCP